MLHRSWHLGLLLLVASPSACLPFGFQRRSLVARRLLVPPLLVPPLQGPPLLVAPLLVAPLREEPVPLTLINDRSQSVCHVNISPSHIAQWGSDWLGAARMIPPGTTSTFQLPGAGRFDLRLQSCRYDTLAEAHNLDVRGPVQVRMSDYVPPEPPLVFRVAPEPPPSPPVQVHLTNNVSVNGAAPMADDVVTLRDGSLLRGRIAELRPGRGLTLVLLTGQARDVAWQDVATTTGPSFASRAP
jgi:hypothetical protein